MPKQFYTVREFAAIAGLHPQSVYSMIYGTSDMTVAEMVSSFSTFANKGVNTRPLFVTRIEDKNGNVLGEFIPDRQEAISEETAFKILNLMEGVYRFGTAIRLRLTYEIEANIAGKTGTAQTPIVGGYDPSLTIASFVGFAPADDPQFVALVKLDKPTTSPWGAVTAAPTFSNVARILIAQLAIPPQP